MLRTDSEAADRMVRRHRLCRRACADYAHSPRVFNRGTEEAALIALGSSVAVPPRRQPLYRPGVEAIAATQLSAFMRFCEQRCGRRFGEYAEFELWAIREASSFWTLLLQWSGLKYEGQPVPAITDAHPERARFFPGLRLSYVENVLRLGETDADRTALTSVHWDGSVRRWSYAALCSQVASLGGGLQAQGLQSGEPVALVANNTGPAVVAALAAAALGCPIATAAPELGPEALLARLSQIEPAWILADVSASSAAVSAQRRSQLAEVVRALPSLRSLLLLGDDADAAPMPVATRRACDLIRSEPQDLQRLALRRPFDHPLFILFTSGTTGAPKCLVHGAGGTLLEHVKEHRLHCNLSAADKLFFHTSIGWMMWHWQLAALASGAELLLYDGSASGADSLWRIVAHQRVTVFGTSPAYLQLCERSDPGALDALDFGALRAVLSTGSVLYPAEQEWVAHYIKPLAVQSISGGTDIVGCFLLGNPNLPAYSAECQCRSLALDVRAAPDPQAPAATVGELVCTNPFPSRPLGFLHDPSGRRFHAAYFAQREGCWTHGDLVEFLPEGSALLHGRSDGVLNIRGIRIGPAEIYRILRGLPEVCEALAVEQLVAGEIGGSRMVLLVVLQGARVLDAQLIRRIQQVLLSRASPAHVPDVILQVAELPTTYSGKHSEVSAREALNGREPSNAHALRNPWSLEPLRRFAREGCAPDESAGVPSAALTLELMTQAWQQVLGIDGLEPSANFFELSGHSLTALRLMRELQRLTGRELALSLLYQAPTLQALLDAVNHNCGESVPATRLRLLHEAHSDATVFLVPGIGGSAMELQPLARALPLRVFGLEAPGLHPGEAPCRSVEEMAHRYLAEIRALEPTGPYYLAGYSFGGLVAYEIAQRLASDGAELALLVLLDTTPHERFWPANARLEYVLRRGRRALRRLRRTRVGAWHALAREAAVALHALLFERERVADIAAPNSLPDLPAALMRVRAAAFEAFARYRPQPIHVPVLLIRSDLAFADRCDPVLIWSRLAPELHIQDLRADHYSMIRPPDLPQLAACLTNHLQARAHEPTTRSGPPAADFSPRVEQSVQTVML